LEAEALLRRQLRNQTVSGNQASGSITVASAQAVPD